MHKTLLLVGCVGLGFILPGISQLSPLITPLLMVMLFFSFLKERFTFDHLDRSMVILLGLNIIMPIGWYILFSQINPLIGYIAFFTAIAPTGIGSPIIMHLLKKDVGYVTTMVVISNTIIAVVMPILVSLYQDVELLASLSILTRVLSIIILPLVFSLLLKRYKKELSIAILPFGRYMIYVWSLVILIAVSKARKYLDSQSDSDYSLIALSAGVSLLICITSFLVGYIIGPKDRKIEASQILGQKNTMFVIWFIITFSNPIYTLGPVFYIIYHNLYNSFLISKA